MTATPHAGKEEDFQLLLALLDGDRFVGRHRKAHDATDVSGLMLRRVKEELLTFEGRRLFPERFAATVPYKLSDAEAELYEQVTAYVRNEMNRADQLRQQGEGRRGNTVGFALTVLQRRLASSPEAILRSLVRRHARLEARLRDTLLGPEDPWPTVEYDQDDELLSGEREKLEEEVVDAATAARTAQELRHEIAVLEDLVRIARRVRLSGTDVKWQQLRQLLTNSPEMFSEGYERHKIIIFTEHRDTLGYLTGKIATCWARQNQSSRSTAAVSREDRLKIQDAFRQDPKVTVLVATDAAGEGIEPAARAPDDQLRPAVESQPHRAAIRPHPPDRPDRTLPPVEPGRGGHP